MSDPQKPKKTVSDIVRKLLKSNNISVKRAASYINCTEQSFRNKLSRDSFSIKDLLILCYISDARLMVDYCAFSSDYDMDFLELTDYLSKEDFDRVKKLEEQYISEDLGKWVVSLTKSLSNEELLNMSNEDLGMLIKEQFHDKVQIIKADVNSIINNEDDKK